MKKQILIQRLCILWLDVNWGWKKHIPTHPFNGPLSRTTQVSQYQKGKTNLDFTEARDSGISWAICNSAPRSRQITTPAPHRSVFYRPDALPANSVKALKANDDERKHCKNNWQQQHQRINHITFSLLPLSSARRLKKCWRLHHQTGEIYLMTY